MKTTLKIFTIGLLAASLFSACSKSDNAESEAKYITVKGSDTMVHLASSWAEAYMDKHADANISVTGGGSGTGIAALLNGTTDICIASRRIKEKEVEMAKKKHSAQRNRHCA